MKPSVFVFLLLISVGISKSKKVSGPPQADWCGTQLPESVSRSPSCLFHDCDAVAARDSFSPNSSAPWLTIRIMLHVFENDDGSQPAADDATILFLQNRTSSNFAPYRIRFAWSVQRHRDTAANLNQQVFIDGISQMRSFSDYALNPGHQLNVMIPLQQPGFLLGIATFPFFPGFQTKEGTLVLAGQFIGSYPNTLTHEMGHCFGLWHTHHGVSEVPSCSDCYELAALPSDDTGDLCSDTPPTPVSFECDRPDQWAGSNALDCKGKNFGETQFHNFMGYSHACTDMFSLQQAGRMRCYMSRVLSGWLTTTCSSDCSATAVADSCTVDTCSGGFCALAPKLVCNTTSSCQRAFCSNGACVTPTRNCTISPSTCLTGMCDTTPKGGCEYNYNLCPAYFHQPCCTAKNSPICGNMSVAKCVCDLSPSCCQSYWSPGCVTLGMSMCGLACNTTAPVTGTCASPINITAPAILHLDSTFSSSSYFTFGIVGSDRIIEASMCTSDPFMEMSLSKVDSCVTDIHLIQDGCTSPLKLRFWGAAGVSYAISAGAPTHGVFDLNVTEILSCSVPNDCWTDACHVPTCTIGHCEDVSLDCSSPDPNMNTWCDREDGCHSYNQSAIPPYWTCGFELWFDGYCDCDCGGPDRAAVCPNGTSSAWCDTNYKCNSTWACIGTVPPAWTCSYGQYNDGSDCDCGCGTLDPDCVNAEGHLLVGCSTDQFCNGNNSCQNVPSGWTCDPAYYSAHDGCDCDCGIRDPDCNETSGKVFGCGATSNYACLPSNNCTAGPWVCPVSSYGTRDGCDCGCGSPDPDCGIAGQQLKGCPASATGCSAAGSCTYPASSPGGDILSGSAITHPILATIAVVFVEVVFF